MKNKLFLFLYLMFLFSCENREQKPPEQPPVWVEVTGKLDNLLRLPKDSVLESYDLSGDFLMDFPNLSAYTIKSLNLSHNYLDTVIPFFLPQGIERLNLSHNYLSRFPQNCDPLKELKDLNLSHNYIKWFSESIIIDRLDISYNDLNRIIFNGMYFHYRGFGGGKSFKNMNYLNISNNPNLSNKVYFVPSMIDTIVRDNIANDKELEMIDWLLRKMKGLREVAD